MAALSGHAEAVRVVLAHGGEVNGRESESGNTALMLAANRGFLEVAHVLIAAGADVMAKANDRWTALEAAEMIGDEEMAALLRAAGARH